MSTGTLTDHSTTIRSQIEAEVRALRARLEGEGALIGEAWPIDGVVCSYVEIGYLVNCHHGHPLFKEGDIVAGLPVSLTGVSPRTIRVCADNVRFVERVIEFDEVLQRDRTEERTFYKDLSEQTTW